MTVRQATPEELKGWDARTVDPPGGHVYQSLAWAEHRSRTGWRAVHLVDDSDGGAALALLRPWPWIGGSSAYLPRGPIAAGATPERLGARLAAMTDWLAERGVDVVATDAEVEASSGYRLELRRRRFRPIPEIQPSRHRVSLPLPADGDETPVRAGLAKSTRQRINAAERANVRVARYDTAGWRPDRSAAAGRAVSAGAADLAPLFEPPDRPVDSALDAFYSLLETTGDRRGFRFGPRSAFVPWWRLAHDAGHLVYLEANSGGAVVGGLVLYRHGDRLSTVHSADAAGAREAHPGVMHLLRWRAIQLALREGRREMDLGGVDIGPDHREPAEDGPMTGL
ncbi:MAG: GNAT family N-acetyltransferase [Candidatus Limnocylindrales bacterium]